MLSIAICDDMPEHSVRLHALLNAALPPESSISEFQSAEALTRSFETCAYDLFFLDIELGSDSGIQLAKRINDRFPHAQIVFVTANIINAVDVGEANHTYFLTKPVDPAKLKSALDRVTRQMQGNAGQRLSVTLRGGGSAILAAGDILYCERTKRTTTLMCVGETLISPESLEELEAKLPKLLFARPHNSFLVNLAHVGKLERTAVYLDNGASVSVTNQRKKEFRAALAEYVTHG